jgi:flagellar hook assembly protein FlgD
MVTKSSKTAVPAVIVRLYPTLPNPFSESTCVTFEVYGDRAPWRMELLQADGRVVRVFEGNDSGHVSIIWHGDDEERNPLPSGAYWCRVSCGTGHQRRRLMLIR